MPSPRTLRPGVTVMIPVKDRAGLLAETLRSVREQTRPVDEILVIDDGSVDDSAAVARDAGATVIVNERPGLGPAGPRNVGLEHVGTELVCPFDSDDLLLPPAIELLEAALIDSPDAPFVFGRALSAARHEDGWRPEGIIAPLDDDLDHVLCALFARNFVPSCAAMARTADVLSVGCYAEDLPLYMDHHLWLRLARNGLPVHVPELVSVYRRHPGNLSNPVEAREPMDVITEMANEDPRLAGCRPERLGVQLFETVNAALKLRHLAVAAGATWTHLVRESERDRILRAAIQWARARRQAYREAEDLWTADADLRDLLSSYL
jgi:glycosyltransferase involved in cell wall biosynthesis